MFRTLRHGGQVALLFMGWLSLKEMFEAVETVRNRHLEYGMPERLKTLTLEEAKGLFDRAEFQRSRIYAIHRVEYSDISIFKAQRDATSTFWKVGFPSEIAEKMQKEIFEEMAKQITEKGLKTTIYNIIAYAQKQ